MHEENEILKSVKKSNLCIKIYNYNNSYEKFDLFYFCDLDLDPPTFVIKLNPNIVMTY